MDSFKVQAFFEDYAHLKKLIIAYSGGLDSTVLLHLLANHAFIKKHYALKAIHINHHLSRKANRWAAHCQNMAKNLNVDYAGYDIYLDKNVQQSLEAQAREKRYAIFEQWMTKKTALVTAHHQDDQAETVLLQLMRGTGITGLAAMPACKTLNEGLLLRPLLPYSREALMQYAKTYQLNWIDDESNFDTSFDRNYLRHDILPLFIKRWPQAAELLSRTARHAAASQVLLDDLAQHDLANIDKNYLDINVLKHLKLDRQKNCIRYWLKLKANLILEEKQLITLIDNVILSRHDAMPCMAFGDILIRRFKNQLHLVEFHQPIDTQWFQLWDLKDDLNLPFGLGILKSKDYQRYLSEAPLMVCFRTPGLRVLIRGRDGHRKLKHLMQEWEVPTWERESLPLVFSGERLISAGTYYFEDDICEQHRFV